MKAALILEDGTAFEGLPFAKTGKALGETVCYTGVVGYQEVLTDPSYRGTLTVLTYPLAGNYGVNADDSESPGVQASGVVIRDCSARFSNFRATGALEEFLAEQGTVGIRGVDTRALAVHLREHGEMKGLIASGDFDREGLLAELRKAPSPFAGDLLADMPRNVGLRPVGPEKYRLAVMDLGATRGLLDQLAALGCAVDLLKPGSVAREASSGRFRGLVLAGGPGDPRRLEEAAAAARAALGRLPVLGIGLGHQVLALALGGKVGRMKLGHHGVNHPVRELASGRCQITVQSHSFVVEEQGLPATVEVTYRNVNDGTVEGLRSKDGAARSVQFHPTGDEMGRPSAVLAGFLEG